MALAVIGIVVGSIMAAKFSKYYINMGLVSIGSLGITVIVFLVPSITSVLTLSILFTLFGVFSGLIIVPLNTKIQFIAPRVHLGTIIAGSNFIQNIFMVVFLGLTTLFAYFGMNAEALFFVMGFVGVYLTGMVYKHYEAMSFLSVVKLIAMFRHSYSYKGLENIPKTDGVLLLGNHVSWLDWIILQIPMPRQINYMMDKDIYNWKFFNYIFRTGEAIPISPKASKDAFREAHKRLMEEKVVGIFPEGAISKDGELSKFMRGFELIPKDYNGVIVPFYIDGVFGSMFSKYKSKKTKSFFSRRKITVYYGKPLVKETTAKELQEIIQAMKNENSK